MKSLRRRDSLRQREFIRRRDSHRQGEFIRQRDSIRPWNLPQAESDAHKFYPLRNLRSVESAFSI